MWEIRRKVFRHLSRLSIDYYEKNRAGEILEKVSGTTMEFARWVFTLSDGMLGWVLMTTFILIFLWIKLPLVGLIMTISLPLNFYLSFRATIKTSKIRKQWHQFAERGMGEMNETIQQIATVRSFAQEEYKFERYLNEVKGHQTLRYQQARVEWNVNVWRNVMNGCTVVLVLGVLAYGALNGRNSAGDIILVALYLTQMRGTINPLAKLIVSTGDLETSASRLVEIMETKPTVTDKADAVTLKRLSSIEFKNVEFVYPGTETPVLSNISFNLKQGETLALVGPSGVGKTTITKLLMRFYAPTSGEILVNGQPIERYTQDSIRARLGTVLQDVALFNDTIEENLRFAYPDATESQITAAATVVHADEFISKLPDGYKTIVGERGIKLSGGQKQRVAIARAVLRNPQLIILDEATASLDSESEKYVQDGLERLMKNKTAVIIAHRLSTVRRADKILVLENGQVSEEGTHDQLVKNKAFYSRLLSIQNGLVKD